MRTSDIGRFAFRSLGGYPGRTALMILAMSIGVAAVVVLTSLGEGARGYVRNQFAALGTNLMIVFPGRAETAGGAGGFAAGRTPRDLTINDALALRRIRGVRRVTPLNVVAGEIAWKGKRRDVPVIGSTHDLQYVWNLSMSRGTFLPPQDARYSTSVCVIGATIRRELFGGSSATGQWVRVGDRRFRVIGVLAPKGTHLGVDIDELAIIPVAAAQELFNLPSLLRIAVEAEAHRDVKRVRNDVRRVLRERHGGEEDVTVITEDALSSTFDKILLALTLAVGGIASISLAVAGILVMNVMLIAVTQRTSEIGLLKAIGASPRQIRVIFFAEATLLSLIGAATGLLLGQIGSFIVRQMYPALPAFAPGWAVAAAIFIALANGIIFTIVPARRAAALDAALALARR